MKVCVLGLGFVGLTFAVFAAKEASVSGVDVNLKVVRDLQSGRPRFYEDGLEQALKSAIIQNKINFAESIDDEELFDVFVISVGTPMKGESADNRFLESVTLSIQKNASRESLVILRSTVEIGSTRKIRERLSSLGHKVVFAPERTAEGAALKELSETPQIIGSDQKEDLANAASFFESLEMETILLPSLEEAEFAKLAANSYRDYRFAFANHMASLGEHLGINARRSITAVNHNYSRGNIPLPGTTGGPCLEKDPLIFATSESSQKLLSMSRVINNSSIMDYLSLTVSSISGRLGARPQICVVGAAFKGTPLTSDTRGSFAIKIYDYLIETLPEAHVSLIDTLQELDDPNLDSRNFNLLSSVGEKRYDLMVLQNNNAELADFVQFHCENATSTMFVIDFWGMLDKSKAMSNVEIHTFGGGKN